MHFSSQQGLTFDDVILIPGYNGIKSRSEVTTSIKIEEKTFEIPIASSNMDTVTGVEMACFMRQVGGLALLHRFVSVDDNIAMFNEAVSRSTQSGGLPGSAKDHIGISIGIGNSGFERAEALVGAGAEIICVDVAHGHSKEVNRTIKQLRTIYKDNVLIIAGNVATYAGADYLAAAGADMIKVGIGCGSVCSTRIKTGFGVPQLTAILECSKVDRSLIADGGIRTPADAVKALAAGADMVMLGGMLAGTDESPGEVREGQDAHGNPRRYKAFRGMASKEAQEDFMGSMSEWKTSEGVAIEVACKGPARQVIQDVMGGIRSGMTYCGASEIRDLKRKAQFMPISAAGYIEGTPHAQRV